MATDAALVTDASDDQQAMRRESRLRPSLINTAGHVCWLVAYLLRWIFYKVDEWLIYLRWRWRRKVDYYESIDQRLFKQLVRESGPKYLEIQGQQMRAAIQCLKYYTEPWARPRFRFEDYWTKLEGFGHVVEVAWNGRNAANDPARAIDQKLRAAAKALRSWQATRAGNVRLQLAAARAVIYELDTAQESRPLSPQEIDLRKELKQAVLGLASMCRIMARQRARVRHNRTFDRLAKTTAGVLHHILEEASAWIGAGYCSLARLAALVVQTTGLEYVLASEKVMENTGTDCSSGVPWTHGNFVARQWEAWCFSFLYGPPTLFFFEMNGSPYHGGIVTCAPLDEPVNEVYRFLGVPLWWAKRRSGKYDCVCLICGSRHWVEGPCPIEKFSCGHRRIDIDRLCKMCYRRSEVLHPSPGEFEHGYQIDAKFSYFCVIA